MIFHLRIIGSLLPNKDYDKFIKIVPEFSQGLHIPEKGMFLVHSYSRLMKRVKLWERTSIRHSLTGFLLKVGGLAISGMELFLNLKKKGYATSILKESLSYVKANLSHIDKRVSYL